MSSDNKHSDDLALKKLREILFKQECSRISAIKEIHYDLAMYAVDVAKFIAEAITLRRKKGDDLGNALRSEFAGAFHTSFS